MEQLSLIKEKFPDPLDNSVRTFYRHSVRGIIFNDTRTELLMIYSQRYGDFGFPGGGIETNETHGIALVREIQEETGYTINQIMNHALTTEEFRKSIFEDYDFFHMKSDFYFCSVDPAPEEYQPTQEEFELKIQPKWVSIKDAHSQNSKLMMTGILDKCPWIERETRVLEFLMKNHI
jgi:8-oxo-dGTP pyrophosphatase MutT (NUDIX family)